MSREFFVREYFTLYDYLFNLLGVTHYEQLEAGIVISSNNVLQNAAIRAYNLEALTTEEYANESFMKTEATILFTKYIYPSCKRLYVGYCDNSLTTSEKTKLITENFFNKFIQILNNTYEKNKFMLDTYTTEKNDLLNKVESISVTKFNDTPQVKNTGEYDDSYNSSVTTNRNSTELNTLMARIAEIDVNMRNLYQDWAKEFGGLWIYE